MKRFKTTTACFDTINQCFDLVKKLENDYHVVKVYINYTPIVQSYFVEVYYD